MKTQSQLDREMKKLLHDGVFSMMMSGIRKNVRGWTVFHGEQLQRVDDTDLNYTGGWIAGKLILHANRSKGQRLSPRARRLLRRWHRRIEAERLARKIVAS